jgi:hypothetical protein
MGEGDPLLARRAGRAATVAAVESQDHGFHSLHEDYLFDGIVEKIGLAHERCLQRLAINQAEVNSDLSFGVRIAAFI